MATRTWVGTDAGNEGNWNTAANWSEGSVPVVSDDVYFVSGSQDVTTGPTSPVNLSSINVGSQYSGSSTVVIVTNATNMDYANKQGSMSFEGNYDTVNVQETSTDSPALTLNEATVTTLRITGGNGTVLVTDGSTLSSVVDIIGARSVRLEIESGVDASAVVATMDNGKILTYEEINTLTMFGGTCEFANATGTTNTVTMYEGTCLYNTTGETVLTTLTMFGGLFDMRESVAPSHTITNTTVYSGATIDERNGLSNTTYTNAISLSGIIKCDLGRSVTVT